MSTELETIQTKLINMLKGHIGSLKVTADTPQKFEVSGTIPAMQGKKKVDGFYFASVVPKPKDIRLYFFPTYTHKEQIGPLHETVQKCLKGKSCFHIKKLDEDLEKRFNALIKKGIDLYKKDGLI